LIDKERRTLLIDEGDNLELSAKAALRAVLNSGHRRGGAITRFIGGQPHRYPTFAPIALASIGFLTSPLMSRSIVIRMTRHDGTTPLRPLDLNDTGDIDTAYRHIMMWVKSATINPDPEMPDEVRGRVADNWRPLIAIADACSPAWGDLARAAAIHFARRHPGENIVVQLLRDIRAVFDERGVDRIYSEVLVKALVAMDDAPWSEWRGVHSNQTPRKLSQGALAGVLGHFEIYSRSIWPRPRAPSAVSKKGYYRHEFERTWRAYCAEGGTPAQASKIKALFGP
jgi:hypothetical protein